MEISGLFTKSTFNVDDFAVSEGFEFILDVGSFSDFEGHGSGLMNTYGMTPSTDWMRLRMRGTPAFLRPSSNDICCLYLNLEFRFIN